jgi:hypothetical protein
MRLLNKKKFYQIRYTKIIFPVIILLAFYQNVSAQELPPRPITISVTAQTLSFGAFCHGPSGGTITINTVGNRSATGDIVLLNLGYSFSVAVFEVVANPGTLISILEGTDVSLAGSNSGSMTLHIGSTNPASPFITTNMPPTPTLLYVGGTLTVSNSTSNPAGIYNGNYEIILVEE